VWDRSAGRGDRASEGPIGRRFRDLVLPTILKRHSSPKAMRELSWLFDHHIDWHDAEPSAASKRSNRSDGHRARS
jgi:hypothetical protein